jgi:hypothetical protein
MEKAVAILKRLEWSKSYSYCTGWPCCPICGGIKPGFGADEKGNLPLNQGHRPACALAEAIAVPNAEITGRTLAQNEADGAVLGTGPERNEDDLVCN